MVDRARIMVDLKKIIQGMSYAKRLKTSLKFCAIGSSIYVVFFFMYFSCEWWIKTKPTQIFERI